MLQALTPPGAVMAELGTFRGDLAHDILTRLAPRRLHVVDLFEGEIASGDADGNHMTSVPGPLLEALVRGRLQPWVSAGIANVSTQSTTSFLAALPDAYLDVAYVDADHRYEGVREDLRLAMVKVKPGGLLCGHDYEINPARARTNWVFGVRRAVEELRAAHGLDLLAKGLDGCVSFCIRVPAAALARPDARGTTLSVAGAQA